MAERSRISRYGFVSFCIFGLSALTPPALAEGETGLSTSVIIGSLQASAVNNGVIAYEPEFFTDYNPQNAADMVRRVPGFSLQGGDNSRGLAGNLSNLLINGRRPSSKQGPQALLSRIPARAVLQVELIVSPQPGIDMAGYDQLVNLVIDRNGEITGTWSASQRLFEDGQTAPRGDISITRATDRSTLTTGVEFHSWAWRGIFDRTWRDPANTITSTEHEPIQERWYEITPSLSWERNFEAGHTLRIDAESDHWNQGFHQFALREDAQGALTQGRRGVGGSDGHRGEITLDFDYIIDPKWSVKLTGFQRLETRDGSDRFVILAPDGTARSRTETVNQTDSGESVGRSELRYEPNARHATTLATEVAFNFREQELEIFAGLDLTPVLLPVANTRVEEIRYDGTLSHVWQPNQKWSLEAILGYETSTISQSGDAEQERDLSYFKPGLIGRWTPNDVNQFSLTLRREVSQLDFGEFVSSVNIVENLETLGNPNLEPERTTRLQADWQRRFNGEGSFTLEARYEWVEGVSDSIPLGPNSEGPGNLGDGTRIMLEAELTTPLDRFGVPGGLLTLEGFTRQTEVDDPLTGEARRFEGQNDWRAYIEFRQDLPNRNFAWGFDYAVSSHQDFYRINRFVRFTPTRGDFDLFVERRYGENLTGRLGADFNFGEYERVRYQWDGNRATADLIEIEHRTDEINGVVYVNLSGTF